MATSVIDERGPGKLPTKPIPRIRAILFARTRARIGIEQLRQDIRSARKLGPDLADYATNRASIDRSLQRIGDAFSKVALEKFGPALEKLANILEKLTADDSKLQQVVSKGVDVGMRQAADSIWPGIGGAVYDLVKAINGSTAQQKQQLHEMQRQHPGDLFTLFEDIPDLTLGENVATFPHTRTPVSYDASGRLQLPLP